MSNNPQNEEQIEAQLPEAAPQEKPPLSYRHLTLGLLLLVYIMNFLDRQLLSILLEPIKQEFELNDTQLGLLGGIAFAIFYVTFGLPIGRLADRYNRTTILAVCMALWSVMTVLCGYAVNFITLMLARIGVAVGEAGGSPPSHSIISDLYPAEQRGTVLSVYSLGIPIGSMIALIGGGWLADTFDWRTAFIILGIPGLIYALVFKLMATEPPRGYHSPKVNPEMPSISETLSFMVGQKSFLQLGVAAGLHALAGYGLALYFPAFLVRHHEITLTEAGLISGILAGTAGGLATFAGGFVADRMAKRTGNPKWYLLIPAYSSIVACPLMVATYLSNDLTLAILLYIIPSLVGSMYLGPTFTLGQNLSGTRMRALASSILLFILNIIGLGLGPLVAGILSDSFRIWLDVDATRGLQLSLVVMALVYLWSALHYFLALRHLPGDLETAKAQG
ncbi:MAG: MFS transporter [Gammaproteobacteria bacterium AqS3]|nr:MFS transporter [Gammaproteobacteria bacterium AqS3]